MGSRTSTVGADDRVWREKSKDTMKIQSGCGDHAAPNILNQAHYCRDDLGLGYLRLIRTY